MLDWYDLNARHVAIFLWMTAFLVFVLVKSSPVRKSVLGVLRSLDDPLILPVVTGLVSMVYITTAMLVMVKELAGWEEPVPIVAITIWFLTSGFSLLLRYDKLSRESTEFWRQAKTLFGPSTAITAFVDFSIMPLWWELLLFPFVTVLVLIHEVGFLREGRHPVVAITRFLLLAYLAALILLALKDLVGNPDRLEGLVQVFLLPVFLTSGALPYMKAVIVVERMRFDITSACKTVRSIDYGADWPLTVDAAKLCRNRHAVWVEVDGKKYGLNGTAKGVLAGNGHACCDLAPIWKDHTCRMGKVNISRLLQDGLALDQPL